MARSNAKCHVCGKQIANAVKQHGGILGHCGHCDRPQYIIAPSLARKLELGIEFSNNPIPVSNDELKEYREIANGNRKAVM